MYSSLTNKYIPSIHYRKRTAKIDTITIHHMAGNLSIETCGKVFQNKDRLASSNYGIGSDGRIACYVPDDYRAITSSNWKNDDRAITIEVANIKGEPNWEISDKALCALIELCADICIRYEIPKLLWHDDKNLIGQIDKQNITIHKWFTATKCPGPYLHSKIPYIVSCVNDKINGWNTMQILPPYLVRVTANVLNIRSIAGTDYKIVGTIKKGEVYTIVEEKIVGTMKWGKLKSGVGWICLNYTEKL